MQKNLLIFVFLFTPLLLSSTHSILAASATPSGSPISEEVVEENLKKRLQESIKNPGELSPQKDLRSYVGIVKDVIKDTIIIEDKDGKKDIQITGDSTIIRSPGNTTIKSDSIRIDDSIIAIGEPSEQDVLLGKRLIVSADPINPPAKTSSLGTISKINKTTLELAIGDQTQSLSFNAKTIWKSASGTIELTDLSVGDTLIYTASTDKTDTHAATIVMRIATAAVDE